MKTILKLVFFLGFMIGGISAYAGCYCATGSQGDAVAKCSDGSIRVFEYWSECNQYIIDLQTPRVNANNCMCSGDALWCSREFKGYFGTNQRCNEYIYQISTQR